MKLEPLVIADVAPEIMYNNWVEWKDALEYMFDAFDITDGQKKFSTMMTYGGRELQRLYKKLPRTADQNECMI